ncbi:MAG: glutamate-1-semialdehyde-2,1-aminomutase [Bacteroidetes bacterium QH_10_64_19]|nr:MAG: glutamate-1-semialdehyde-2,1-aminomutase [Bacteroidetes bacterium QH_10_64_19]
MDVAPSDLDLQTSRRFYERAQHTIPGGVNSPARAFDSVGGTPLFIEEARGAYLKDADGNEYLDYVGSWGPMIFGHAHPDVVEAVQEQAEASTSFGAPTRIEIDVAELVCDLVPSVEKVRMVNSGTEATMSAARLARGYTGRDKIIKFEGNYHGHGDFFLIAAGSGAMTLSEPDSPGVTKGNAKDTLLAQYNDIDHVQRLVEANQGEVACIVVEPIAGNMGCIPPEPGFLEGLRELCDAHDIVLVFDEVMTGFRVAPGGVQERYGGTPDLTCLGKIIGGGLPVGAYGGRQEIMDYVSPTGPVYQAGTLSGNPLAMRAGHAILSKIAAEKDRIYRELEDYAEALQEGTKHNLDALGLDYTTHQVGAMGSLFFTDQRVVDQDTAQSSDTDLYASYFHAMLEEGIYLPPSQFEAMFFGTCHGDWELDETLNAQRRALKQVHS